MTFTAPGSSTPSRAIRLASLPDRRARAVQSAAVRWRVFRTHHPQSHALHRQLRRDEPGCAGGGHLSASPRSAFPTSSNRHDSFLKLDHQLRHSTIQLRLNRERRNSVGGFGGLTLASSGTESARRSWDAQPTVTSVLGARAVNELRVQVSHFVSESTNLSNEPSSSYIGFATFGANPGSPQDIDEVSDANGR